MVSTLLRIGWIVGVCAETVLYVFVIYRFKTVELGSWRVMATAEANRKEWEGGVARIPLSVSVLMLVSDAETRMVKTRDISDVGVFLLMGDPKPEIGEVIRAQVIGLGEGEAPIVEMSVYAVEDEGVECRYIST